MPLKAFGAARAVPPRWGKLLIKAVGVQATPTVFKKGDMMIVWCDKPELKITSDIEPCTGVRKPLPSDSKEVREDKKKFPYINKKRVLFDINYLGTQYCILIEKGFVWDGATCLGLHHLPKFLNPSLVHDKLCNKHELVGNDRQLSSIIFREMCIASGVNKIFAYTAYHAVDNFQKFFGRDLEGNRWK